MQDSTLRRHCTWRVVLKTLLERRLGVFFTCRRTQIRGGTTVVAPRNVWSGSLMRLGISTVSNRATSRATVPTDYRLTWPGLTSL